MGFGILIWGFIFLFFDFNLGTVNLFPNLIGFVLIVLGMREINRNYSNENFQAAGRVSYTLSAVSAIMTVTHFSPLMGVIDSPTTIDGKLFIILINTALSGATLYYIYHLCKGIVQIHPQLTGKSEFVRNIYSAFVIVGYTLTLFGTIFLGKAKLNFQISGGGGILLIILVFGVTIFVAIRTFKLLSLANHQPTIEA